MHPKPAKPKHKHPAVHACVDDIAELAWYALKGTVNTCIQLICEIPHLILLTVIGYLWMIVYYSTIGVTTEFSTIVNDIFKPMQVNALVLITFGIIDVLNLIGDGVTKGLHKIESIF